MVKRWELRRAAKDAAKEACQELGPNASKKDIRKLAREIVKDDYGDTPWLEIILRFLELLLPLFIKQNEQE